MISSGLRARAGTAAYAITVSAAIVCASGTAGAQRLDHAATIAGHPNFNGIWQPINDAKWNLEAHSIEGFPKEFGQLGAIGVIPAGPSMLKGGGKIPYLPDALKQRDENRSKWPEADPEAKCYMLGVPRATYQGLPFQISEGDGDLLLIYPFAATHRIIHMKDHGEAPVDSWMGKADGTWEGNTLVVVTNSQNGMSWLDRAGDFASNQLKVTERFRLLDGNHIWYEATLEDPQTFSKPWTIEMPLYRLIDNNVQLLEHKCVPFADPVLYKDLLQSK